MERSVGGGRTGARNAGRSTAAPVSNMSRLSLVLGAGAKEAAAREARGVVRQLSLVGGFVDTAGQTGGSRTESSILVS